ncbi:hypothetical protein DENSPDRAFT_911382, partial [Dentipellis sp. KUC8613]
ALSEQCKWAPQSLVDAPSLDYRPSVRATLLAFFLRSSSSRMTWFSSSQGKLSRVTHGLYLQTGQSPINNPIWLVFVSSSGSAKLQLLPNSTDARVDPDDMDVDFAMQPGMEMMAVDPPEDPDVDMLDAEPMLSRPTTPTEDAMEVDERGKDNDGTQVPAGALDVRVAGAQRVAGSVEVVVGEPVAAAQAGGVVVTAERRGAQGVAEQK